MKPLSARADQARGHSSATLSEAAGTPVAVAASIIAAWPGARLCGPAYTVQGTGGDNLALHHAVIAAPAGSVLVVDVDGACHGHWGEVLAIAAQCRGLSGLLIDGGVRDVDALRNLGFPVFSRNNSVVGTRKSHPGYLGVPVTIGGVTVHTGDLVVADTDGVVVLPAGDVERVLTDADARVQKEREIIAALRVGATTLELYGFAAERNTRHATQ
jgi:4-hydroxy-4-methyl-2-oxoglutarate aldolase